MTTTPTSANGWPVCDTRGTRVVAIPDSAVKLRVRDDDDVAAILTCIAWWVDHHVEDIDVRRGVRAHDVPDDWGHAVRKIRGAQKAISNHASGTAIDLNAVAHPMGVRGTWSNAQIRAVRDLLRQLNASDAPQVVRWGEDYRTRVDGMHFELNTTDRGAVRHAAEAARRLMAGQGKPPQPREVVTIRRVIRYRRWLPMQRGADVRAVQRLIGAKDDGKFGPDSARRLVSWQRARGLAGDGAFGRDCTVKAGWKWAG